VCCVSVAPTARQNRTDTQDTPASAAIRCAGTGTRSGCQARPVHRAAAEPPTAWHQVGDTHDTLLSPLPAARRHWPPVHT